MGNNNKHVHLDHNNKGRDFVLGDLHGCFDDFHAFLNELNFDVAADRLISVGDLVDRGPNSLECLDLLDLPWFHCVKGNHEDMMNEVILYRNGESQQLWVGVNGGSWSVNPTRDMKVSKWQDKHEIHDCWSSDVEAIRLHAKCLQAEALPLVITVGQGTKERFNVVHAELQASAPVTDTLLDEWRFASCYENAMLWGRDLARCAAGYSSLSQTGQTRQLSLTFVGHTPVRSPIQVGRQIYIDTGAVYYYRGEDSRASGLTIAEPLKGVLHIFNLGTRKVTTIPVNQISQYAV